MDNLEMARHLLKGYKACRRRGISGEELKRVREPAYVAAAFAAEDYIKAQLALGRPYVFYSNVCDLLETDRFTVAHVLGKLQELNALQNKPLWSSFVGYKAASDLFDVGEPGGSFYSCAEWLRFKMADGKKAFLRASRRRGLEELGLTV